MMHDMRDLQCLNAGITPGCYNSVSFGFGSIILVLCDSDNHAVVQHTRAREG